MRKEVAVDGSGKRKNTWDEGEELVARYLRNNGFTLIKRRFRTKYGELDIVAVRGGIVAIVEVKARKRRGEIHPKQSVGPRKQERILRATLELMRREPEVFRRRSVRFDVASVYTDDRSIEYLSSAFEFSDPWNGRIG